MSIAIIQPIFYSPFNVVFYSFHYTFIYLNILYVRGTSYPLQFYAWELRREFRLFPPVEDDMTLPPERYFKIRVIDKHSRRSDQEVSQFSFHTLPADSGAYQHNLIGEANYLLDATFADDLFQPAGRLLVGIPVVIFKIEIDMVGVIYFPTEHF
nr:MAG TPA: hypothetical protein [Caudoviricetes sp.]